MAEQTCAQKLAEAKVAMHALQTGKGIVSVGYGERRVQYTAATISDLRAYISELNAECGDCTKRRRPFTVSF
jgi:hypothetical protein